LDFVLQIYFTQKIITVLSLLTLTEYNNNILCFEFFAGPSHGGL